jgi:hypothetical protein
VAAALCARLGLGPAKARIRSGFLRDLRQGWSDSASRRWLWVMVLQGAVVVPVWLVGYQMLGLVYGQSYLGGAGPWGFVFSGFTAGLIVGAAALMWRPSRVGLVVCGGTGSMALPLAAMSLTAPLPVVVAATAAAGTELAVSMTMWASLVQERIPSDRLSRVTSHSTLAQILPAAAFGVRATLGAGAVIISAAMVTPLLLPQVRTLALTPMERPAAGELEAAVVAPR